MSVAFVRWLLVWLGCVACIPPAQAHKASDAYLTLTAQGPRFEARWDIHLRDLDNLMQLDADEDGRITWGEIRRRWPEIEAQAWPRLRIDARGAHCQPDADAPDAVNGRALIDQHSDGHYAVLRKTWHCDAIPQALAVDYSLFATQDALHRGILRLVQGDAVQQTSAVLVPGEGLRVFGLREAVSPWRAWRGFVREGVWHIATGADHLLFLLALLLPSVLRQESPNQKNMRRNMGAVVKDVLRVVTAFTAAHSITLALSVMGWVEPPSRWVESLIAASVVLAALNNLWPVVREGRWALTFVFGLVHGFGFAGALRDVGFRDAPLVWSLLGFNLGVELGQVMFVAAFLPLAWYLRDTRFYQRQVLAGGSGAIAVAAALWLFERATDVALPWLPG